MKIPSGWRPLRQCLLALLAGALRIATTLGDQAETGAGEGGLGEQPRLLGGRQRRAESCLRAVQVTLEHRHVRQPAQQHAQLGDHTELPGAP
jgi:hypothetical protein